MSTKDSTERAQQDSPLTKSRTMETLVLDELRLDEGSHKQRAEGVCLLEAVAWMAGEEHSDHPACVCPVLGAMGRSLNDVLGDGRRQKLVPLIPRMIGTAGDGMADRRGLMAVDWIIRTYTPTWLRLAKLDAEAEALEQLPEIVRALPGLSRGIEGDGGRSRGAPRARSAQR